MSRPGLYVGLSNVDLLSDYAFGPVGVSVGASGFVALALVVGAVSALIHSFGRSA